MADVHEVFEYEEDSCDELEYNYLTKEKTPTRKIKKQLKNDLKKTKENDKNLKQRIKELISNNDWEKLEKLLRNLLPTDNTYVNQTYDKNSNTLLHLSAINKQNQVFRLLLENEANPCLKNQQNQTPYQCAQNKEIRRILKRFIQRDPDKYNSEEAGLPQVEIDEEVLRKQLEEKKKIMEQEEKEKLKKKRMWEEDYLFRQLNYYDQMRIANEKAYIRKRPDLKCPECEATISGNDPFEYLGRTLCSFECFHNFKSKYVIAPK